VAKTSSKSSALRSTSTKSLKKAAPRLPKSSKRDNASSADSADEENASIDRRRTERRDEVDGAVAKPLAGLQLERRKKVNRRRQIDPTTCERDYTDQEVEFMNALDDYKRKSGRMFPTCSEVLEVLHGLGYVKLSAAEVSAMPVDEASAASAKPMPNYWQGTDESAANDEAEEFATEAQLVH